MELLGRYINGNFKTTILSDGTKIRETEDDEFVPAFAENMDIKICKYIFYTFMIWVSKGRLMKLFCKNAQKNK